MTPNPPENGGGTGRRVLHDFTSLDSYGVVLVMIVVTYIAAVTLTEPWGVSIVLVVQIATVWVTLHTSKARRGLRLVATCSLVLAMLAAAANLVDPTDDILVPYVFLCASLLYVLAPFSIIRHVAFRRVVDLQTLFGALAAYLLFGMAFAFCYRFVGDVQGGPFFGSAGDGTVSDDLFFSFVTLTTTGYGNLVPAGNPGQTLAVLEALLGQLFLVTAVAKVVNVWQPRRPALKTDSDD